MPPSEIKGKRILYTVLNWGLGHAARSIPLIKQLIRQNNEVHIASDGNAQLLLRKELPKQHLLDLPELKIVYSHNSMTRNMFIQLPHLLQHHIKDRAAIEKLVNTYTPDIIIADHRYGSFHKHCHSIFLGHQLSILSSKLRSHPIASRTNAALINSFDEVWVPDTIDQRLSGILSTNPHITTPIHFIGPLSRFVSATAMKKKYATLCVLSGPEPARTNLETDILKRLQLKEGRHVLVRGIDERMPSPAEHIGIIPIATTQELQQLFNQSEQFIGRAGYSTVMDLDCVGLPSELIPTPGQTEQAYLSTINRFITP